MITKNDIIKMARHVARRSGGIPDNRVIHSRRDWSIGLLTMLLLFFGGGGYSGYIFFREQTASFDLYEVSVGAVKYEKELITEVIESYEVKQNQYEEKRAIIPVPPILDDEDGEVVDEEKDDDEKDEALENDVSEVDAEEVVADTTSAANGTINEVSSEEGEDNNGTSTVPDLTF